MSLFFFSPTIIDCNAPQLKAASHQPDILFLPCGTQSVVLLNACTGVRPLVVYGWSTVHVRELYVICEWLRIYVLSRILRCWQCEPGAAAAAAANGRAALAWDPAPWSPDSATAGEDVRRLLLPRQYQVWHRDLLCPQQSSMAWERDATPHHNALLFPGTGAGTGTSLFGYDSANSGNLSSATVALITHNYSMTTLN